MFVIIINYDARGRTDMPDIAELHECTDAQEQECFLEKLRATLGESAEKRLEMYGMRLKLQRPGDRGGLHCLELGAGDELALVSLGGVEEKRLLICEAVMREDASRKAVVDWGFERGIEYAELAAGEDAERWERLGFVKNGMDGEGRAMLLLPPAGDAPMTVGLANGIEEFWALILGLFAERGGRAPDGMGRSRMIGAMSAGRVAFITVRRQGRPVGLCSVSRCFSSLTCWDAGVLDDIYIEPAFRGRGVEGMLVEKAAEYCRKQGIQSLSVTGAQAQRLRGLGFTEERGECLAMPLPYETE